MAKEDARHDKDAASSRPLAQKIGTGDHEFDVATEKGYSFPAAGIPDFAAIEEFLGLFPEMLQNFDFTRQKPAKKVRKYPKRK